MKILDEAFRQVPSGYFPHICAIWAKNVVVNDLGEYFKKAEEYCMEALKQQPKETFPYTAKLLVWLIMRQNENVQTGLEVIKKVIREHGFPKNPVYRFFNKELWELFPASPVISYKKIISDTGPENLMESFYTNTNH
ncbi:MAG TPA: hypothetical protein ENJ95_18555 [Bacteroidetes bacterium]|nr:hypothetical protein [Bacteroidota bacterium]